MIGLKHIYFCSETFSKKFWPRNPLLREIFHGVSKANEAWKTFDVQKWFDWPIKFQLKDRGKINCGFMTTKLHSFISRDKAWNLLERPSNYSAKKRPRSKNNVDWNYPVTLNYSPKLTLKHHKGKKVLYALAVWDMAGQRNPNPRLRKISLKNFKI